MGKLPVGIEIWISRQRGEGTATGVDGRGRYPHVEGYPGRGSPNKGDCLYDFAAQEAEYRDQARRRGARVLRAKGQPAPRFLSILR